MSFWISSYELSLRLLSYQSASVDWIQSEYRNCYIRFDLAPITEEFMTLDYRKTFIKNVCKLNPDDFLNGKVNSDKTDSCKRQYDEKLAELLIDAYDLTEDDTLRIKKKCQLTGCHGFSALERRIRKDRTSANEPK